MPHPNFVRVGLKNPPFTTAEFVILAGARRGRRVAASAVAFHPAPQAQCLLAPRFSVGNTLAPAGPLPPRSAPLPRLPDSGVVCSAKVRMMFKIAQRFLAKEQ